MSKKKPTPTQPQCRTCAHYTGFACTNRKSCMYNVLVGGKGFCGEWEGKDDEQEEGNAEEEITCLECKWLGSQQKINLDVVPVCANEDSEFYYTEVDYEATCALAEKRGDEE